MATQDVSVILKWDHAFVRLLGLLPQPDGSIIVEVQGGTKDSNGKDVELSIAKLKVQPGQLAVVDNMLARALIELRKANGLES